MTCSRPRRGPGYWEWRCLNCDRPIADHASWFARLRDRIFGRSRVPVSGGLARPETAADINRLRRAS